MRFKARFISRENSNQDPNILALIDKDGILNLDSDGCAYFVVACDKYQNFRTSMLKCDPMLHDSLLTFQTMNSSYVFEIMEIITYEQALAEIAGAKEESSHQRCAELEAQAAVLRQELQNCIHHIEYGDTWTTDDARKALSSTAGRELLERMERVEKALTDSQRFIEQYTSRCPCQETVCKDCSQQSTGYCIPKMAEYFLHKAGVSTP